MDAQDVCFLTNNHLLASTRASGVGVGIGVAVEIGMGKAAAIPNPIATPIMPGLRGINKICGDVYVSFFLSMLSYQ
jgi:hypothetical protein